MYKIEIDKNNEWICIEYGYAGAELAFLHTCEHKNTLYYEIGLSDTFERTLGQFKVEYKKGSGGHNMVGIIFKTPEQAVKYLKHLLRQVSIQVQNILKEND